MIKDANQLQESTLVTRICIVGAGAAGITLSLSLSNRGVQHILLESGDREADPTTQYLYHGENVGTEYYPLDSARLRYFGGSTNHWTGWTRPLDAMDFRIRPWIADSGWPITSEEMKPYYKISENILDLGEHSFDIDYWERKAQRDIFFSSPSIRTALVRHSPPTRFAKKYGDHLQASSHAEVLLNANLADIECHDSGKSIKAVTCKTLRNKELRIAADVFVIACGGIENARILLACRKQHKQGIGNQNDLVGRYFADHRGTLVGLLATLNPKISERTYRTIRNTEFGIADRPNAAITTGFRLADEAIEKHQLLNHAFGIVPTPVEFSDGITTRVSPITRRPMRLYDVIGLIEPPPNPASRVMLDEEQDALGMPRSKLDFRLSSDYETSCSEIAKTIAQYAGATGMGRMNIDINPRLPTSVPEGRHLYGFHHMGTTRMHTDPKRGVTDRNCKIHGLQNLYIAGSSLFTTYGYAQPTLTIVALALRLGDHLHSITDGSTS